VIRIVQDQRDARYNLLRGFFHGADDDSVDELEHERLATVTLASDGAAAGRPLAAYGLVTLGVRVLSLRRAHGTVLITDDATVLQGGDTLVLSGKADTLALAEQRLLKG
jgi:monovalent cation:H+ antiporter-2, CPA2 family